MLALFPAALSSKTTVYIIAFIAAFYAGWVVRTWKADSDSTASLMAQQEALRQAMTEREKAEARNAELARELERRISTIRSLSTIDRKREYEKPAYTKCNLPSSGVQHLNRTIGQINQSRSAR